MREFRRPAHQLVGRVLHALDADLLLNAECYFGGGTQLALTYGEYRESRDIDFLCSSRTGFRKLRECVTQNSLGRIVRRPLQLAREVRADREGIRTFFAIEDVRIKLELLLEGRIDLGGSIDKTLGVPVLTIDHATAEKFLANTDRGLDESALGRDLIDLAFLAATVGKRGLLPGLQVAEGAYGSAVRRSLAESLNSFQKNRARSAAWLESLCVFDTETLRRGLRVLRTMV
jgi:Nucleotidyl transferase AbiEii toxin, Type IV TA system